MTDTVASRLRRKAASSICRNHVAAVAYDRRNRVLGFSRNSPRFIRKGGGIHAESVLFARYGRRIRTIVICRIGGRGFLPICPCDACAKRAKRVGVTIVTLGA